eukprot:8061679-Alexandrium_andersonii.AAC.1
MSTLKKARISAIDAVISGGGVPYRNKQHDIMLRLGSGYTKLEQHGKLTPAGEYFYSKSGQERPGEFEGFTARQRGATDFLVGPDGKARVLRRKAGEDYRYTKLGE